MQSQPVTKKEKENSNEPCQSLHSKTWPIPCNIMAHLKGSSEEIEVTLTKSSDKDVQKNRDKLQPIVDMIILLGRLGLPFRGHRDDSQYHKNVGEYAVAAWVTLWNVWVIGLRMHSVHWGINLPPSTSKTPPPVLPSPPPHPHLKSANYSSSSF